MTAPAPAEPRFITARRPGTTTTAPRVGRLSAAIGRPYLPWQFQVSALLNERTADGRRSHGLAVISSQRQAGKSRLALAELTDRCLHNADHRAWITSNTGAAARELWLELTDALLAIPALTPQLHRVLTNGHERLTFRHNGSQLRPFPPTQDSLHGKQADTVVIDEGWSHDPMRGRELIQAVTPAQATRFSPQVIIMSAAGTAEATWFKGYVDRGRAGDPSLMFAEWGIADGVDPGDIDAVAAAHPAVPYLIDRRFLADTWTTMADAPGEYARAFGNRWSTVQERAIPGAVWAAAATTALLPAGRPCFAADIALDRSRAAIVAVNQGVIEVVESRADSGWVASRLMELIDRHNPAGTVVDNVGPSAALHDELTRRKVELLPFTVKDYAAACETFLTGLGTTVKHRPHPALNDAVDNAAKRQLGDGGWAWGRRKASGPICELTAATFALFADLHRPAAAVKPQAMAG